ncbi:MAG TPA: hypothetical protein VKZ86_02750, partial [Cyclobacteriaceae bacterium]|nr:hypothetical protein [Cyclobacteriaceae bacterium]
QPPDLPADVILPDLIMGAVYHPLALCPVSDFSGRDVHGYDFFVHCGDWGADGAEARGFFKREGAETRGRVLNHLGR